METKKTHLISMSLPVLQNVLKRDPDSYKEEFLSKYEECLSMLNVFQLRCSSHNEALVSSVSFISQVVHCYKTTIPEVQQFPEQLINILQTHGSDLDADMRMTFCRALISLRNNGVLLPMVLLDTFFQLFSCPDKVLRKMMYNYIVQDIKNVNTRQKNVQLNKALQNYMYKWMDHNSHIVNKMCLDVMIELYRRKIWNDDRTVNVMAKSLASKNVKVLVTGLKFFLGVDKAEGEESDSDDDEAPKKSLKELVVGHRVGKHSRKRQKRLERAKTALEKHKKKHKADPLNFSAIHLLNDPQELADKLLDRVMSKTKNEKFEVRLLILNFVSRLIGLHELILLKFYEQLKLFLKPSQSEVTKLLLYVAQASHELVPPEELEVVIGTIASNFITERNADEVIAVGLNAVREICARCPLAMSKDLLDDLVEYKGSKDKGVMMAARSLITLYRQKNPKMLHKSNRGKPTEAMRETRVLEYGQKDVKDYIPGAEVLSETEEVTEQKKDQDEWESCSEEEEDDDDGDGSWVDVRHSSDEEGEKAPNADNPASVAENIEKAKSITQSRILTNEDFNKIKLRQVVKEVDGKGSKKRTFTQANEEGGGPLKEIIPLEDIELVYKKRRHDRESRLATVMAGREGRGKFGQREKRMNPHASTSNKDKRKTKAFSMVKHKIREKKGKRSFQEKSKALKQALLRKLKAKK